MSSIAGIGMQAYSAMNQAKSQQQAAEYNAAVQRNNAIAAEYQAKDAYQRGEKAVDDHLRKVAALRGTQTARMAANGVSLDEGTPLNILTDTDLFAEIDTNTIRNNAAREAWGYQNQAANSNAQAALTSMSGRNANPLLAGAGSLITGVSSVADRWYQYNKVS